jgi:hypothetical protein
VPNPDRYTIGDIQASLGFKITGEFITSMLGITPVERDKRAQFYTSEQFDEIKDKLRRRIGNATLARAEKAPAPAKQQAAADDDEL